MRADEVVAESQSRTLPAVQHTQRWLTLIRRLMRPLAYVDGEFNVRYGLQHFSPYAESDERGQRAVRHGGPELDVDEFVTPALVYHQAGLVHDAQLLDRVGMLRVANVADQGCGMAAGGSSERKRSYHSNTSMTDQKRSRCDRGPASPARRRYVRSPACARC